MSDRHADSTAPDRRPLEARAMLVVAPTAAPVAPAIAEEASRRGARVALAAPDRPPVDSIEPLHRFASPLQSATDIDRVFDAALDLLSRLHVVIVVLAVPALHALHSVPLGAWSERVTTPLRIAFWVAQRALDEFLGGGAGGRLIFVVDRPAGERNGDGQRIVAEAVTSLSRSLAREYGRRAVSSQVAVRAEGDDGPDGPERHRPVVDCALFLASSAASFVTGEVLTVVQPGAAPTARKASRTP